MATKDSPKSLQQPLREKHQLLFNEEVRIQKQGARAVVHVPFCACCNAFLGRTLLRKIKPARAVFFVQFETTPFPDLVRMQTIYHDEHAVLPL